MEGTDIRKAAIISIHASREGSDEYTAIDVLLSTSISIHASREGSDRIFIFQFFQFQISIHASREGSDLVISLQSGCAYNFNPRFPRGKRLRQDSAIVLHISISIHASREGSDENNQRCRRFSRISIHASREGSDPLSASVIRAGG